jgi:thiamine-monophosphate kinase
MRDEFAKIDWLKARFELESQSEGVVVGIGDDAAVFDLGNRPAIVTVDTQVEGVHFRRDFISCLDVGYRAMMAAVSDVWAMGALPSASVVALTLPSALSDQDFRDVIEGLAGAAQTTGARVIGGNLSRGESLSVTTTVFGFPIHEAVTRAGANPGDSIYVTGTLGAAALGLAILDANRFDLEHAERFVERWRRPPMTGHAARSVAEIATAAVDISDGCLQDLQHVCDASGVGATLNAGALPTAPGFEETCEALGLNPLELVLGGGEDYELLFTAPSSARADAVATKIGVTKSTPGVDVLDESGKPITLHKPGFRHFS